MKKLVFSVTFVCYSLSGRSNIVDAYHNIPTHSHTNNPITIVPVIDSTVAPVISNPVEVISTAVSTPDIVNTVVDVISNSTDIPSTVTSADIVDTVGDTVPKKRLPLIDTVSNVAQVVSVPNVAENAPALAITDALPAQILVVENIITNELANNTKHESIICYKKTVDNITYFIFAPNAQKNYLSDTYQTIIELVTTISAKLQEYFAKTDSEVSENIPEATTSSNPTDHIA